MLSPEKIKKLMEINDYSISKLSMNSGVSVNTIKGILYKKHTDVHVSVALRLSIALNTTVNELCDYKEII